MAEQARGRGTAIAVLGAAALALLLAWWFWRPGDAGFEPAGEAPAAAGDAGAPLPEVPDALPPGAPDEIVSAPAPGAPAAQTPPAVPPGFEFGKRQGATVSGIVLDPHGRPAAKIPVYSTQERGDGRGGWHWTPRGSREFHDGGKPRDITTSFVYSKDDGTFELLKEFLPDKPITLQLDPAFLSRWQAGPGSQATVQPGATGVSLTLADKPTVRLRVVDAVTGALIPTAGASVWMTSPFTTEWAGDSLRIFLRPGRRSMLVHAPNYEPTKILIQMPDPAKGEGASDALWPETVRLSPGLKLAGTLRAPDGTPVAREACVYLEQCDPELALDARPLQCTDPERDGSFTFGTLRPGTYRLVVVAARYETFDLTAPLEDLAANAAITLKPGKPGREAGQGHHDWSARRNWPVPLDSWYGPLAERLRILETIAGVRIALDPGVQELLEKTPIYGLSTGAEPLSTRLAEIARSFNSETEEQAVPVLEFDAERGAMRVAKK